MHLFGLTLFVNNYLLSVSTKRNEPKRQQPTIIIPHSPDQSLLSILRCLGCQSKPKRTKALLAVSTVPAKHSQQRGSYNKTRKLRNGRIPIVRYHVTELSQDVSISSRLNSTTMCLNSSGRGAKMWEELSYSNAIGAFVRSVPETVNL